MQVSILNKLMIAQIGLGTFGFFGQINQFSQILEVSRNAGSQLRASAFQAYVFGTASAWLQAVAQAHEAGQPLFLKLNTP
jgi:hypothetical protein